jgi:surfeit locus 1 family protein
VSDRRGGIVGATLSALVGIAILCGLGVWQVERKVWKEDLIATLTARLTRAPEPEPLPPAAQWPRLTQSTDEYSRVKFTAEFLAGQEALVYTAGSAFRPDVQGAGYWVFAPARLADGGIVLVDRGFVPAERKDAASQSPPRGAIDIVGVMRWPEAPNLFTPAAEPQNNTWYVRDSTAIAAAKKWDTAAPFYIEQEAPAPPGGLPKPGRLVVALPDNHLQYAITWFGLALALAGVYGVWLTGRLRRRHV